MIYRFRTRGIQIPINLQQVPMENERSRTTINVFVSGKVQGVFFRSTMKSVAETNNVVGWVRNLPNGDVEALVQGDEEDVNRVIEWCKLGPSGANVTNVRSKKVEKAQVFRKFAILY